MGYRTAFEAVVARLGSRKEKKLKTLHSCFHPGRFKDVPEKGEIGIEIETEVEKAKDYPEGLLIVDEDPETGDTIWRVPPSKYWMGVYDGSLRNYGIEFILQKPLDFLDTMVALDEFGRLFKDVPFLKDQPGTSVHVHLNFLNRPIIEIANFITVFTLFENLLTEFAGTARRSNLFARPHRVADGQLQNVLSMFKQLESGGKNAVVWSENATKYANLNIATLGKLGSLEIRCFRGTTDVAEIQEWVAILHDLYTYARRLSSPYEFFLLYKERQDDIIRDVFPGTFELLTRPVYWQGLVHQNEFYMAKYALALKDWSKIDENYRVSTRASRSKKTTPEVAVPESEYQAFVQMATQVFTPQQVVLNQDPVDWFSPPPADSDDVLL
jgi:hypothetical protein